MDVSSLYHLGLPPGTDIKEGFSDVKVSNVGSLSIKRCFEVEKQEREVHMMMMMLTLVVNSFVL